MKTTAQKRKEAWEERASDPYAYQRSLERREKKMPRIPPARPPRKPKKLPDIFKEGAEGAAARMRLYLATHPQQMDHDRDIVLLDIHRMLSKLLESKS
jgi:deoxyribodipyrimidine photolyase